uniref:Uncharacterized protein n=1 Tax=Arundo donax TaxID=35708 RepID=A0A0A8XTW0_ARUDO
MTAAIVTSSKRVCARRAGFHGRVRQEEEHEESIPKPQLLLPP